MTQYIDKSALVAEIRRRFDEYSNSILKHYDACKEAKAQELGKILIILDTLEVKDDVVSNDPIANSLEISRHGNPHNGNKSDLEEAASQYPSVICQISPQWTSEVENVFKAGAQWQKEQMINKAFKYINYQLNLPNDFEQHFRKAMEE